MAGGAETPNIAALPAIARLGACESDEIGGELCRAIAAWALEADLFIAVDGFPIIADVRKVDLTRR